MPWNSVGSQHLSVGGMKKCALWSEGVGSEGKTCMWVSAGPMGFGQRGGQTCISPSASGVWLSSPGSVEGGLLCGQRGDARALNPFPGWQPPAGGLSEPSLSGSSRTWGPVLFGSWQLLSRVGGGWAQIPSSLLPRALCCIPCPAVLGRGELLQGRRGPG